MATVAQTFMIGGARRWRRPGLSLLPGPVLPWLWPRAAVLSLSVEDGCVLEKADAGRDSSRAPQLLAAGTGAGAGLEASGGAAASLPVSTDSSCNESVASCSSETHTQALLVERRGVCVLLDCKERI